jgi:BlaI family transcriptional regulator, penicillinase repressor
MARRPAKTLTERELEIMQVIWALREARLGEVQEALNKRGEPVAASTVATQLNLLVHKGYLTQTGRSGRSVYVPTFTQEEATKNLLDDFLARVGLRRRPAFLIRMLKNERLSADDRAALEEILRDSEKPESPRKPRSRFISRPPEEP